MHSCRDEAATEHSRVGALKGRSVGYKYLSCELYHSFHARFHACNELYKNTVDCRGHLKLKTKREVSLLISNALLKHNHVASSVWTLLLNLPP